MHRLLHMINCHEYLKKRKLSRAKLTFYHYKSGFPRTNVRVEDNYNDIAEVALFSLVKCSIQFSLLFQQRTNAIFKLLFTLVLPNLCFILRASEFSREGLAH